MESIGEYEYSKKDLIGHGAFAVVFKGRHKKKHDFVVAIKCITKKNLSKSQNLLTKEIKILKELSDLHHENVVALLDCKETANHVYLVMEYCNCGDLADYLLAKGTLSEDTISFFLKQIAGAMKALNAKGIVHRDMKPQNILLAHPTGRHSAPPHEMKLKIADFGFARFLQDGVMAATLCGSPMYMAPEVIMSLQYDAKADLWSIGTIVYQCLTGKAPFQAQTPQQLKQFYEKNANLQPNIPSGTSPELKHLLMGMLRRNAKDRMDFDDFFNHPYVNPKPKAVASSSPVTVPRSRSRSSMGESPNMKAVSASPLSAGGLPPAVAPSPPPRVPAAASAHMPAVMRPVPPPAGQEPMEVAATGGACGGAAVPTEHEDFVLVPKNIPLDPTPAVLDLKAIFSEPPTSPNASPSPGVTKHYSPPRTVRPSPYSTPGSSRAAKPSPPSPAAVNTSPSRPSSLPVSNPQDSSPVSSPSVQSTQPVPVPTQKKAYEQIQRSIQKSPGGSISPAPSPSSPGGAELSQQASSAGSTGAVAIPQRRGSSGSLASIGSMSPPSVQFSVGTPPHCSSGSWKRQPSQPIVTMGSPHRKQAGSLGKMSVPGAVAQLPPIVGSPTKTTTGFFSPTEDHPIQPLNAAFASSSKSRTCPSQLHQYSPAGYDNNSERSVVPVVMERSEEMSMERSRSTGQLIKAAFGGQLHSPPSSIPGLAMCLGQPTGASGGGAMLVPYSGAGGAPGGSSSSSMSHTGSNTSLSRQRTYSDGNEPPSMMMGAQTSSPNMEGPISFVAPELQEETLMDREHNETVGKLNFMLGLVECIIELAQSRSSPLSQSMMAATDTPPAPRSSTNTGGGGGGFLLEPHSHPATAFMTEKQRIVEQLVLYVRALQLLTSSIKMAKDEFAAHRLQPSSTVKNILRDMNNYYHQCLQVCRNLHSKGATSPDSDGNMAGSVTADQLIYSYAIESCQTAALDELFGNPQECVRRYRNAQILLHGLSQQAHTEVDRDLFIKYREAVEKRLFNLQRKGYVHATDTSTNTMSTQDC